MSYSNKQLYDALSLIKSICENHDCDDCPMYDKGTCKVSSDEMCPADWALNYPDHWRAFN